MSFRPTSFDDTVQFQTVDAPPTLLDVKRHYAERLPRYMIADEARFIPALPRTRNGKVDHLKLARDAVNITEKERVK